MKFRKKPIVVEAHQWFKLGDVPEVDQYYDEDPHLRDCCICKNSKLIHGMIETLEGDHIVCPGDWVITGIAGEKYPCKANIFEQTYERFEE
jgi:hypothetical protein